VIQVLFSEQGFLLRTDILVLYALFPDQKESAETLQPLGFVLLLYKNINTFGFQITSVMFRKG
jgi:hypothetical protein